MDIQKLCLKCLREIIYDTTEHYYCCECFAARTIPDEDGMPTLEGVPDFWVDTEKIIKELNSLRELREICGMYCEQLPVEVSEVLHRVWKIEKTHQHLGLCRDCGQRSATFEGLCSDCNEMDMAVEEAEQLHYERWLNGEE